MAKYVIIGNSAAAIGAVEAIRKTDKDNDIIIISQERYHTYSRPLISYLLLGKTTEEKMLYRAKNFYDINKCKLLLSKKAVKILPDKKAVILDDGQSIDYEKLLVATGSSPFIPPITGLDTVKKKCTFTSLDEAKALNLRLDQKTKVLIIGAGLIGLKCAEGISKKVHSVAIVDLAPRVLSSILDEDAAAIISNHLVKNGLQLHLEDAIIELKDDIAYLKSGKTIPFDVLVIAVGVRPNTQLIKEAGGEVNKGIVINNCSETSLKDIYAAGDCVECLDISSGDIKVMALLPNAYMQGECAGFNMSGNKASFDKAIPMNAIGFFGKHIISAGNYKGEVCLKNNGTDYRKLYYSDNKLNGFIAIGNIERSGIYTSLIRESVPLDSIDFALVCDNPALMAFSTEDRRKKLGGGTK